MAQGAPRRVSFAEVARAVFWSFFGVRKGKDYENDSVSIRPVQVIAAGLIRAVLFVLTLATIVKLVTS